MKPTVFAGQTIGADLTADAVLVTSAIETDAEFRARITKLAKEARGSKDPLSLTIDGETQAVLVSPVVFDAVKHVLDDEKLYASMDIAFQELKDGKGEDVNVVFDRIEAKLLKMQAEQVASAAR